MAVTAVSHAEDEATPVGTGAEPGDAKANNAQAIGVASRRRALRRVVLAMVVVALLASAWVLGLWARSQSQFVLSRNALVRGELTEVGTRLSGVLVAIEVHEGERVKAGQTLARLYDRDLRSQEVEVLAQIDGLERGVKLERSTIEQERLKLGARLQESVAKSEAARAEVAAAQSRANEARAFLDVRLTLLKDRIISPEAVRDAEAKHATTLAMLDVARANAAAVQAAEGSTRLDGVGMDLRKQRVEILEDSVRAAKARLEHTRADLDGALIRAPGDGAVIRWLVKSGGSVQVGKPIVAMSIGRETWIEAWFDEDEIHRVKVGSPATVTLPSYAGHEFKGVVDAVGLTTDFEQPIANEPEPRFVRMRRAPMVGVRVRLQDAPDTLLPGLSAAVAIRREDR